MKQFVVLAALIAVAYGGTWKQGLRTRFDVISIAPGLGFGNKYMFDVPKNLTNAQTQGWTKETRPNDGYLPSVTDMYCHSPPVVCALFDDNQFVVGLQIALNKKEFTSPAFDMNVQGFTDWSDSTGEEYWTLQEFFVSEDYLVTDKTERLSSHVEGNVLQQDNVWFAGMNHKLYSAPVKIDNIENTDFTNQGCIIWMGLHYYYNMSSTTECTADKLLSWAPLYDDGQLVGASFSAFGSMAKVAEGNRDWFEHPPRLAVKATVRRGPDCLYDLADSPGVLSMHTYFVDNPRLILCANNDRPSNSTQ